MKSSGPNNMQDIMRMLAIHRRLPRHSESYAEFAKRECQAMAKKFGDPSKLTPAKFKRIKRVFRNAAFAAFGEWEKL
ncbi:MAG TPA: hypothetical protein VJN01_15945 [Xanthomonadales bacterium]|nr:hypothetical protein [Xanthomonadales bacterium]